MSKYWRTRANVASWEEQLYPDAEEEDEGEGVEELTTE